ncbi:MAG: HAMP domain-containing sensor histidine kinase [Sulfuricurvum sp.]|uniref:sensor histidine kinase n=1 Tax=Sulfuricurvum sp. TaxID=2025608 RepID=UPI00262264A5|nr:HAMP domain-containing sensor histidine kinase [Sulfuricurvum sp.]MDD2828656.1 HAMP domain-containing sensor histidine kinase [Sulfuricurvum sp.]MDD4948333.1 HAMP domain-containing sensor histidine kinase [Sulfuricurvum sp.]
MHSLIAKFAIFFWLLYIAVTAPMFIFIHTHNSAVLNEEERSKIRLVTNTLKPIISTYLSFDQQNLLNETMHTFFQNPSITRISLMDTHKKTLFEQYAPHSKIKGSITLSELLKDPITGELQATLYISYSNTHAQELQNKLFDQLVLISLFALLIFSFTFLYFRKQFFVLSEISDWMGEYIVDQPTKPFQCDNNNKEIRTIISSTYKMLGTIDNYKDQMEEINSKLEQRIETEMEKRRQKEQLLIHQSRLAAMGEMIESIAHQWRQPLNVIGLAMSNMEMKRQLGILNDSEIQNNSDIITTNLTFMSNTIDDFRNFFNLNKEKITFKPTQPINDIFHLLSEQLHYAKITYAIHNECSAEIYGVVNEFKQVILNIINNAKDAIVANSNQNGGRIDVVLRCEANRLIIDISDTGGGVPSDISKRIFEPYFTTKFQKQGTGIGLYMSKVIIEQHFEGNISVSNNVQGAIFTISLSLDRS